jgi:hypothetical protein
MERLTYYSSISPLEETMEPSTMEPSTMECPETSDPTASSALTVNQQTSATTAIEESPALDSSGPSHSNNIIPELDRGQIEPAGNTTSVNSTSRSPTPDIPDDIVKHSRAGDASRSLMLHKSREAKEVYNKAFNSGIAKVQAICMEIAKASGQTYKKVEADMFAAISTKHKRKAKPWDTYITKKMNELNDGKFAFV